MSYRVPEAISIMEREFVTRKESKAKTIDGVKICS
jgi:hypothetical protein